MTDSNIPIPVPQDESSEVPADLAAAIARTRQITASPEMVARLTAQVTHLPNEIAYRPTVVAGPKRRWQWMVVIAASLVLAAAFNLRSPTQIESVRRGLPETPEGPMVERFPIRSAITAVSLSEVGYQRVLDDLDRADARIAQASEEFALVLVRQEIQDTLDEFSNWSL